MPKFNIERKEKETVQIVSFNKASDYKVVKLNGEEKLLHKIQADRLIAAKKAEHVKDAKIKESVDDRTVTPVSE